MRSPITDAERPWLEVARRPEGRAFLIEALMDLGHRADVARGVAVWLDMKAHGLGDTSAADTRSRYRKILRELTDSGVTPPTTLGDWRQLRRRRSQVGASEIGSVVALAGVGVGAVAHSPVGTALAGLVYITYTAAEPDSAAAVGVGEGSIVRIGRAPSKAQRAPAAHLVAA